MQSPPLELVTDIGGALFKNLIRAQGEADHDTISEQLRGWVERTPYGEEMLAAACVAVPAAFFWHIVRPLRLQ